MEINLIFKIAAVGIIISILNQILKHSGRDDQAFLTGLAGLLLVLYWILPYILEQSPVTASAIGLSLCLIISINIINNISAITGQLGVMISLTGIGDVYIKIIMKIIGITFITQLISDVCRDNGFNAAASQLEIMCKIAVATISIPIVLSLMEMINKCIK